MNRGHTTAAALVPDGFAGPRSPIRSAWTFRRRTSKPATGRPNDLPPRVSVSPKPEARSPKRSPKPEFRVHSSSTARFSVRYGLGLIMDVMLTKALGTVVFAVPIAPNPARSRQACPFPATSPTQSSGVVAQILNPVSELRRDRVRGLEFLGA